MNENFFPGQPQHGQDVVLRTALSFEMVPLSEPNFDAKNNHVFPLVCLSRTKRWIANPDFDRTLLLLPRAVALDRMPLGIPAGSLQCFFYSID